MNGACCGTILFCLGPWGGAIRSNIITSQLQRNFVCLLTNERYKIYQRRFQLVAWVMPQGWDLGVPWGVGGSNFFPELHVSYMNGTRNGTMFWVPTPWGLGEGPKGQISLNLNYKVNFKDFKPNFVCSHK